MWLLCLVCICEAGSKQVPSRATLMPLYQQLIIARDTARLRDLTSLLKACAIKVLNYGGNVRGFENHGVRPLTHRLRNRRASEDEKKYHCIGRFISGYFDSSPAAIKEVDILLRLNEDVLRYCTLRPQNKADSVRIRRGWRSEVWSGRQPNINVAAEKVS